MLTKLASLSDEEKRRGVIGISAGNHAQALAYCAALVLVTVAMMLSVRDVRELRSLTPVLGRPEPVAA